ncbi:MAG: hypothetical protein ABI759_24100 [Candidatus Solibacter sp.]
MTQLERHPRAGIGEQVKCLDSVGIDPRLYQMIRDRGHSGSVEQLRRVVARLRPQPHEAFLRLQVFPAEQAQVDWAYFGSVMVGRAKRQLSCFVMTLSWSRAVVSGALLRTVLTLHVDLPDTPCARVLRINGSPAASMIMACPCASWRPPCWSAPYAA